MNILHICPPHLAGVATLPWEIQKSFLTLLFIHFRLLTLAEKKTNSNCCTAALAVYLLLVSASYYLHSPSTSSGAHYRWNAYIDTDMLRIAAAACCDMGWISAQRGVLCDWSVSKDWKHVLIQKMVTLNTCYDIILLAWHSSCHTLQPVLFRATDYNAQVHNKSSSGWKSFAVHKLVWWHFQVGWASGLQFVFFWDNVNNQKYVWIILLKMTFWIFQGKVATCDRWGGQNCKIFMSKIFLRI